MIEEKELLKLIPTIFDYNQFTGCITHKEKPRKLFNSDKGWKTSNRRTIGKIATIEGSDGYLYVSIRQRAFPATRVIALILGLNLRQITRITFADGDKKNLSLKNLKFNRKGDAIIDDFQMTHRAYTTDEGEIKISFFGTFNTCDKVDAEKVIAKIREACCKSRPKHAI